MKSNRFTLLLLVLIFSSSTARATPPSVPANVRAIVLPAEVLFTWDASAGADYYRVYRGGPNRRWVPLPPVTETRFRDADFVPLPGYYQIAAFNNAGESSASAEFQVLPATANISLIGVTPRPLSDTSFAVAWTINGPQPFMGFGRGGGGDGLLEVGLDLDHMTVVGASATVWERHEFVAQNLLPNTTYFYRLTSAGANNAGFTYVNTFTTRPQVPPSPSVVLLTDPTPSLVTDEDVPVEFTCTAGPPWGTPLDVFILEAPFGYFWGTSPNFAYLSNPDHEGGDYFDCAFTDGMMLNFTRVYITVRHVEDPPIALDQSVACLEEGGVRFNVRASGWDFDPSQVDCAIVAGPTNGVLTRPSGTKMELQYVPNTNYSGIDHVTFQCFDNNSTGNLATVRIHVSPVNNPPVTPAQSVTVQPLTALLITLAGYEPDALQDIWGAQRISFGIVSPPAHGALGPLEPSPTLLPLSVVYTPAAGFSGADSFSYFLADGEYAATGVVSIVVQSPPMPSAPSSLTATAHARASVALSWADHAANESGFKIERSLSPTSGWAEIGTVGPNVRTFIVSGQKPNKVYFRVCAFNSSGRSDYSNIASARGRH